MIMTDEKNTMTFYKVRARNEIIKSIFQVISSEKCWMKVQKEMLVLKTMLSEDEYRQVAKTINNITGSQKQYAEFVRDNMMSLNIIDILNPIIKEIMS